MPMITFLLLAFPRAGILVAGLSATVQSIAGPVVAASWYRRASAIDPSYASKVARVAGASTAVVLCFAAITGFSESPFKYASLFTIALAPLGGLIGMGAALKNLSRSLPYALLGVSAYALVQFVTHPEAVAIPGLTHVLGERLIADNPLQSRAGTIKSPSTFQNGNLYASFAIPCIGAILALIKFDGPRTRYKLALAVGVAGVVVSLARLPIASILFAATLTGAFGIVRQKTVPIRTAVTFFLSVPVLVLVLVANSESAVARTLQGRFIAETLSDPTGAGRSLQYSAFFDYVGSLGASGLTRMFAVGISDRAFDGVVEGYLLILAWSGLIGVLWIAYLFKLCIETSMASGLILASFLSLPIQAVSDNSILYPPTLFNWFLLSAIVRRLHVSATNQYQPG